MPLQPKHPPIGGRTRRGAAFGLTVPVLRMFIRQARSPKLRFGPARRDGRKQMVTERVMDVTARGWEGSHDVGLEAGGQPNAMVLVRTRDWAEPDSRDPCGGDRRDRRCR